MPKAPIDFQEVLGSGRLDRRLEVLRTLHHAGSISEAARANGVSYKAAWQAIETLSNLAGVPLVTKAVGGSGGGGARLTPEGLRVLKAADLLNAAREQALSRIERIDPGGTLKRQSLAGLSLRTSMRNQLPCIVQKIIRGGGMARIILGLADGQTIASRITLESVQLLGLRQGLHVLAMFKATAVTIAPTIVTIGGVNLLQGRVLRRGSGSSGTEVSLQIDTGLALVGFADPAQRLKLRERAMAAVEDHGVVIGLPG